MLLKIWKQWVDTGYSVQWCQDYFIQYKTMKRVRNIYEQLVQLSRKIGIEFTTTPKDNDDSDSIMLTKCLISGF